MFFSPQDLLLWTRCRRQWFKECLDGEERWPALPREMTGEANLREVARVVEIGGALYASGASSAAEGLLGRDDGPAVASVASVVLDEERTTRWIRSTSTAMERRGPLRDALLEALGQTVLVDLLTWHPKLEGWRATLFRPGTGLRGIYFVEAAAVQWVFDALGLPLRELFVAHLNKTFRVNLDADWTTLFQFSNLRRRAERKAKWIAGEVAAFGAAVRSGSVDDSYRCAQGCGLCVPRDRTVEERFSVFSLHKGGQLARDLAEEGVTDLRNVDASARRVSGKQRIQIESVVNDRMHVDRRKLARFLNRLAYPLFFLDFEAYAPAIPSFPGLAPYEHIPVIASVHTRPTPGVEPVHRWYAAQPGEDQRRELFQWLEELFGTNGTIVVFSRPFESAMVRQMARLSDRETSGQTIVDRMVDLLEPFSDFAVYHPDQRGKVSLKRVLPAYTDAHYDDSPLQDGMHANLAFTRLADRAAARETSPPGAADGASAAESVSALLEHHGRSAAAPSVDVHEIVTYCGVDTIAMVHLIDRLEALLHHEDV